MSTHAFAGANLATVVFWGVWVAVALVLCVVQEYNRRRDRR